MKKSIILFIIILTILLLVSDTTLSECLVVSIAKKEIGFGEIGENNKGKNVIKYNKGLEAPWCAGFVSYVLEQAKIDSLEYSLSAKSIYNEAKRENKLTKYPQAGDLIAFWRGSKNSWMGHIGIIEKVDNNYIYTIEGNVGDYPSNVSRFKYDRYHIPRLLGFIRIGNDKKRYAQK
jgi:uncharacterized protein (TIGR02594 family)